MTAKQKTEAKNRLKDGQTNIIFGTHALIQEDVQFAYLGFVVVDEQHRFGVEQRKLLEEYVNPHKIEKIPLDKGGMGDFIPYEKNLTERARELRNNPTKPEQKLWHKVLSNDQMEGLRFLRQKPLLNYIVDFYCTSLGLVIEIDGDTHCEQEEYDNNRTKNLEKHSLKVLRFTNKEIMENIE